MDIESLTKQMKKNFKIEWIEDFVDNDYFSFKTKTKVGHTFKLTVNNMMSNDLTMSRMASSVETLVSSGLDSTWDLMSGLPGWISRTMMMPTMAARMVVVM